MRTHPLTHPFAYVVQNHTYTRARAHTPQRAQGADRCWVVTEYMSGGPLGACVYASCKGGATKSFATLAPSERLQRALEVCGVCA